jgi:hypothetical protein
MEDAEKRRRKYLWKKFSLKASAAIALSITGFAVSVVLFVMAGLFWSHGIGFFNFAHLTLFGLVTLMAFVPIGWKSSRHYLAKAKALPYVPPAHGQIATLPADEVLLRGSNQPVAAPDDLLRAAQAGAVESAEELLRAGTRAANGQPETSRH